MEVNTTKSSCSATAAETKSFLESELRHCIFQERPSSSDLSPAAEERTMEFDKPNMTEKMPNRREIPENLPSSLHRSVSIVWWHIWSRKRFSIESNIPDQRRWSITLSAVIDVPPVSGLLSQSCSCTRRYVVGRTMCSTFPATSLLLFEQQPLRPFRGRVRTMLLRSRTKLLSVWPRSSFVVVCLYFSPTDPVTGKTNVFCCCIFSCLFVCLLSLSNLYSHALITKAHRAREHTSKCHFFPII